MPDRRRLRRRAGSAAAALLAVLACTPATAANSLGGMLVANNDVPLPNPPTGYKGNTVTFYSLDPNGSVLARSVVATGGVGGGGGTFAYSRIALVPQGHDVCVFVSNAGTGDITGISGGSHLVTGEFLASATDAGAGNGIGLVAGTHYLYASYSDSSTIATFAIGTGCTLNFVGDVLTVGRNGGLLTGMAIRGPAMVLTYGDGSIESFDISGGAPVTHGDAQDSTGFKKDHLPNGVDITADGHYAVFGDASTTTTLEVSDISSGRLAPTVVYDLGTSWNSGNARLTPDNSLIVATNNSGGEVTAAFFDKATGRIAPGCSSAPLRGFYGSWSYAGAAALQLPTAAGGLLYVPEFGSNGFSSIGVVHLTVRGRTCWLTELPDSPIVDDDDPSSLLSIAIYGVARPLQSEQ